MGALSPKKLHLRFIAATHRNLDDMIKDEYFRLDLYQRLNTFTFTIPSLRERPEDIEYYTRIFVEEFSQGENFSIDPRALEIFKRHTWPGNIRELRNVIERAVVYSNRRCLDIDTAILALNNHHKSDVVITGRVLTKSEIINAINISLGNKTKAAKLLEVHPSTLHRWINKFNITSIPKAAMGRPTLRQD